MQTYSLQHINVLSRNKNDENLFIIISLIAFYTFTKMGHRLLPNNIDFGKLREWPQYIIHTELLNRKYT